MLGILSVVCCVTTLVGIDASNALVIMARSSQKAKKKLAFYSSVLYSGLEHIQNLRETNVELREENPKTSPENLINTFCGAP